MAKQNLSKLVSDLKFARADRSLVNGSHEALRLAERRYNRAMRRGASAAIAEQLSDQIDALRSDAEREEAYWNKLEGQPWEE